MTHILQNARIIGKLSPKSIKHGLKWVPAMIVYTPTRSLRSVKLMGESYKRLYEPWDYKNVPYTALHSFFEHTTKRFDENSKIIVIEGNIGTDKEFVGKKIAEEYDMHYIPDIIEKSVFTNAIGEDFRDMNKWLPKPDRFYDLKDLYTAKDPKEVLQFQRTQVDFFRKRYFNYVAGLRHLLNTGQGVVIERSPFSDRTFADAMARFGYFTREGKAWYNDLIEKPLRFLWKPHMVVYIDVPVKQCMEFIKKKNNPILKDSPLMTEKYLQLIENSYKEKVLPYLQRHGEVLTFELEDIDNMDEILYDMQRINLEPPVVMDPVKFSDWYEEKEHRWNTMRMKIADDRHLNSKFFLAADAPILPSELMITDEDLYDKILFSGEGDFNQYEKGFVPGKDKWLFYTGPVTRFI